MARQPFLRYGLPLAAAGLLAFAIISSTAHPEAGRTEPAVQPARSPYTAAVAGLGVVEPNSELIAIGTQLPGVIAAVHVQAGQRVSADDPLFTIDERDARARFARAEARLAAVRVTEADSARQYSLYRSVTDRRAISQDELDQRRFAAAAAAAATREAAAEVEVLRTELARLTVRAPRAGTVLRLNARAGEYAPAGALREPLLTLGDVAPLHVRVEIDETDVDRFDPAAPAIARARGQPGTESKLSFVRTEPLLRPKRTLTGDGNERIDTRVLEVIYTLDAPAFEVHVGQQVDVYIEAAPAARGAAS